MIKMSSGYQIPFSKKNFILQGSGKFLDNYIKVKELGQGSFAKVFQVQNINTKEIYACKELIKSKIEDLEKFRDEINIMSKCDHPNIIKLCEVYEDSRYIELVMEQCLGGSLLDHLLQNFEEKDAAFSEKEAANIFKQIIRALSYCHNQGICHRDLKMENVLFLTKEENSPIKIIDFGLSAYKKKKKLVQYITGKNYGPLNMELSVGSPHYVSPEVLKGKYNQKCDIWSAGVILYAMLSGCFPFEGETDKDICKAIMEKDYIFSFFEWRDISDNAKDLINHMFCDEEQRYSAEEVLKHPWLVEMSPNSKGAISKISIKHLQKYKNSSNLKKFILTYMASRLKEKEIKDLKSMFLEIDANKDGTISMDEFKKCLIEANVQSKIDISEKEIEDIFKSIDTNNSKRIEYTEFISAMLDESFYCQEEKLMEIFRMLDKDNSGKISKTEIKNVLNKEKIREEDLNYFIKKFDLDNDGTIDYYEFVNGMSDIIKEQK